MAFTSHIGHVGVLAFFVHTSLVLMYSLERMTRSAGRVSLRFYVRRFFRIYPLSVFIIIVVIIFHVPADTFGAVAGGISLRVVFTNLLLVQNIFTKSNVLGPLWSLPYEVQMYLVLPVLYYLARKKRAVNYLSGLFVFFCIFGFMLFYRTGHLNMAAYIPCFLSGVLCYSLRDHIQASVPSALWPPFVLLLISGYCLTNIGGDPNYWIGWIFCLFLGLAINFFRNSANKHLNTVVGRVALYSYGIYLNQILVLYLIFMVLGI
jgi:peptidoglycan/LPS O-acetylase OafA/YrhL